MDSKEPLNQPKEIPESRTINIPPIQIHKTAPVEKLSEENRKQLLTQYRLFWTLRYKNVQFSDEDPSIPNVNKGDLFHNTKYQPNTLRSILRTGIMSGEIGDGVKELKPEDTETHFCGDFYEVPDDLNIEELVSFLIQKVKIDGITTRIPMRFPPLRTGENYSISLIIDGNNKSLKDLFELSGTGLNYEKIRDFVRKFPSKDEYITHKAVLVGIPANFIKKIIISKYMSLQPEIINEIKEIIKESGLDISIFDTGGNLL